MEKKWDFSGYVTKNDLKCSDGRTIRKDAFKDSDGITVPLVWQHMHNDPANVLGHALLENRSDGTYGYCLLNDTPTGKNAKVLIEHGDISSMSIYANQLKQAGQDVLHGFIREVSLVLTGANPGAHIENISFSHSDGTEKIDDEEAVILAGEKITLDEEEDIEHADEEKGKTVGDVFDSLNEEQKNVVYAMLAHAVSDKEDGQGEAAAQSDAETEDSIKHSDEGESVMKNNVFEGKQETLPEKKRVTLTREQLKELFADAEKTGSLRTSFLAHAGTYGVDNIDYLFPDARTVTPTPDVIGRNMEWVTTVLNGAKHSPFSRIRSTAVTLTADQARAKGYVKGNLKKEEVIPLLKRVTTPTTIYKKQKLDRDDIIDIVDLDIVAWLKAEMRTMLDEEIARAVLIGDGRQIDDEDKINEDCIRPIAYDNDMYAHQILLPANVVGDAMIEGILRAMPFYKGSGNVTMFTTTAILTDLRLVKDAYQRRMYPTVADVAAAAGVDRIVAVEVMESIPDIIAIIVNMRDYTIGADRGGAVEFFDDFDIDYNQYKYLLEGRMSGCLTHPKSALVIKRTPGTLATPAVPTFVPATGVVTIPATTGVVYKQDGVTASAGAQAAIAAGASTIITATPATGYSFPHNFDADWTFTRNA
jgi:HK97 family phage prohead protease